MTPDQAEAHRRFSDWFGSGSEAPFLLEGYAGTGKTVLSMLLLQTVEACGLCWTVAAPTHKAVGVLREALDAHRLHATWYPSTLHRLLRLRLERRQGLEGCVESEETGLALQALDLVLIDEASMLDADLLAITLTCAARSGSRLVFVGDSAQLPPVGACRSPVFDLQPACRGLLRQVVRHQGPVLGLASALREERLPLRPPGRACWWRIPAAGWGFSARRPGASGRWPPCGRRPESMTWMRRASSATATAPSKL
ncbi:AAA family ATPase [Synechococcus sp. RSCCF101]|uniref:AAA family ATPase n=1 Tax=Synechococcus sp. RSCCF101 TaxID=2511069 RepID=UPI001CDA255F|nr:AAA family ATPase [Synechococcus sp. RSCCF101]